MLVAFLLFVPAASAFGTGPHARSVARRSRSAAAVAALYSEECIGVRSHTAENSSTAAVNITGLRSSP